MCIRDSCRRYSHLEQFTYCPVICNSLNVCLTSEGPFLTDSASEDNLWRDLQIHSSSSSSSSSSALLVHNLTISTLTSLLIQSYSSLRPITPRKTHVEKDLPLQPSMYQRTKRKSVLSLLLLLSASPLTNVTRTQHSLQNFESIWGKQKEMNDTQVSITREECKYDDCNKTDAFKLQMIPTCF